MRACCILCGEYFGENSLEAHDTFNADYYAKKNKKKEKKTTDNPV